MNGFISGAHTQRVSRCSRLPAANILAAALADGSLGANRLTATIAGFSRQPSR